MDMRKFLPADEEIIVNDDLKFVLTADLPTELIEKMAEIEKKDPKDIKDPFGYLRTTIKDVLYVTNKKEEVDKWVDSLRSVGLKKVGMFISEFVFNCMDAEKNPKKKDSKESLKP